MKKRWLFFILTLVVMISGIGFVISQKHHQQNSSQPTTTKQSSQKVVVVGSTALQILADQASKQFVKENPNATVTVQGGGSGTGMTSVANGVAQIGMSDIYAEEMPGINAKKLTRHPVAVVGITPIVNPDIHLNSLTMKQLANIFAGKITNWKQIGGKNEKITVINRENGSGTRHVFTKSIMKHHKFTNATEQSSGGAMVTAVGSIPGAIGYVAFANLKKSVKPLSLNHVQPLVKNVETNRWKIWAYEFMYTKGKSTRTTNSFIHYVLSNKSQKHIVAKSGFIPLTDMKVTKNITGKISKR